MLKSSHSGTLALVGMPMKFREKSDLKLSSIVLAKSQGRKPVPAHRSLGDRIVVTARECDHLDVGEHAVFDVDRRDVAAGVGLTTTCAPT